MQTWAFTFWLFHFLNLAKNSPKEPKNGEIHHVHIVSILYMFFSSKNSFTEHLTPVQDNYQNSGTKQMTLFEIPNKIKTSNEARLKLLKQLLCGWSDGEKNIHHDKCLKNFELFLNHLNDLKDSK